MTMDPAKILITGLNALTGWHIFSTLKDKGFDVFGTYAKKHTIFKEGPYHRTDLDDIEEVRKLLQEIKPDYIVHARGICDLDLCQEEPAMAWQINVEGTRKMLEAASELTGLKKMIYISTDHVFYGDEGPYDEKAIPKPKHVYGETKWEVEKDVQKAGLPYLIIRPGLIIGKSFQGNKGPRDFLFSRIQASKPTHLFTDEWRTPIKAEDFADKVSELIFSEAEGIYHIAGKEIYNRFDLGQKLAVECGLSTSHIFPRKREEDKWAKIRPENISLITCK